LVSLNHSLAKGDILIKISTICFLTSMVFYMILITYFALKYSNKPIQSQLKVLVLYIVGARKARRDCAINRVARQDHGRQIGHLPQAESAWCGGGYGLGRRSNCCFETRDATIPKTAADLTTISRSSGGLIDVDHPQHHTSAVRRSHAVVVNTRAHAARRGRIAPCKRHAVHVTRGPGSAIVFTDDP
jgi:hypothetical protein